MKSSLQKSTCCLLSKQQLQQQRVSNFFQIGTFVEPQTGSQTRSYHHRHYSLLPYHHHKGASSNSSLLLHYQQRYHFRHLHHNTINSPTTITEAKNNNETVTSFALGVTQKSKFERKMIMASQARSYGKRYTKRKKLTYKSMSPQEYEQLRQAEIRLKKGSKTDPLEELGLTEGMSGESKEDGEEELSSDIVHEGLSKVDIKKEGLDMHSITDDFLHDVIVNKEQQARDMVDVLLNRNKQMGDIYSPKTAGSVNLAVGQTDDISRFKTQFGWNEETSRRYQEEVNRQKLPKPENRPLFATIPTQKFLDKDDNRYKSYLRKLGLKYVDYDLYDYYPELIHKKFTKDEKIPEFPVGASIQNQQERDLSTGASKNFSLTKDDLLIKDYSVEEKIKRFNVARSLLEGGYIEEIPNDHFHLFSQNAPENIELEDATKMSVIKTDDYIKLFSGGIGGNLNLVFNSLYQRALMIRYPVMPIIDHLKKVKRHVLEGEELKENKRGFFLTGLKGGGKSSLLALITHFCYKNDFLIFYIPNGYFWTHGVHFVEPSPLMKGYFDCPMAEEVFMRSFQITNQHILSKRPITKDVEFPVEAGQKAPTNLDELITYGLSSYVSRSVVFKILLDEIRNIKDIPILIAVDEFNFFQDYTGFHFGDLERFEEPSKPVHADEYVMVAELNRFMYTNPSNVIFVCADCKTHAKKDQKPLEDYLLDIVHVPRYSSKEMSKILEYYSSVHWLTKKPSLVKEEVTFMTGAIPGLIWRDLKFF